MAPLAPLGPLGPSGLLGPNWDQVSGGPIWQSPCGLQNLGPSHVSPIGGPGGTNQTII
jgi:hypothetical protein